jgi:predicted O-methyltransferase YrrM
MRKLSRNLRSKFTTAGVDAYLYDMLPPRDAVLAEMERYAAKHDVPIVGPAVGRLLALLVQISGAKRIYEMGSAIGYSTIWLARAAGKGAEVYYTDGSPENACRAAGNFIRAGVRDRIHILTGDSIKLIDTLPGKFDLIFNDVYKHQYPAALRKAVPRLRQGGLLVADNTLWSGRVTRKRKDAATRGIQEFNHRTYHSKSLFSVLIPLRDGVTVCQKL